MMLTVKALAVWLAILVSAVANGVLRQSVLIPRFGQSSGLFLSGLLLSALVLAITWLALPWLGVRRRSQLVAIGLGWLLLTVVFELSFGRFQGTPWPVLLEAYTFREGNLWPVVLMTTAGAPYLAGRLRGLP